MLWFCYSNDTNTFGQGVLILLFVLSLKCTYISGSAAINLVMIANGEADVYPQVGIRCWDIVAGGLIVKEAGKSHPLISIITLETMWKCGPEWKHYSLPFLGGTLLDPRDGSDYDYMSRAVLACATPELAKEVIDLGLAYPDCKRDHEEKFMGWREIFAKKFRFSHKHLIF